MSCGSFPYPHKCAQAIWDLLPEGVAPPAAKPPPVDAVTELVDPEAEKLPDREVCLLFPPSVFYLFATPFPTIVPSLLLPWFGVC